MDILIGNAVTINSRFRSKDHCFVIGKLVDDLAYIISCDVSDGEAKPILKESLVKSIEVSDLKVRFGDFINSKSNIGFGTPFVSVFELDAVINTIDLAINNCSFKFFGE